MTGVVLDASALIAFLKAQAGAEKIIPVLPYAYLSAVNLTEIMSKMLEYEKSADGVLSQIERLNITIVAFDAPLAVIAASLWTST